MSTPATFVIDNLKRLHERVRIVLSRTSHPGNIGAAARAMKTMGLARLYLVTPQRFPDAEADARSVGATDILQNAVICASLDEALGDVTQAYALSARQRDLGPPVLDPRAAATEIARQLNIGAAEKNEIALVFGNEASGLSNADVARCDRIVEIPADADFSSLNLGAAVQLMCYELRLAAGADLGFVHAASPVTPFSSAAATHADVEHFYAHLERVMIESGFHDPANPRRLMAKLRRLFGRIGLERDEVNILRGVLAAVEARMRR